ncbi:MAG: serine protease, partial [Pseudomonadota bacterium]
MTSQARIRTQDRPLPFKALTALILGFALLLAQALSAAARGAPESFADLADQISPSVVNITT